MRFRRLDGIEGDKGEGRSELMDGMHGEDVARTMVVEVVEGRERGLGATRVEGEGVVVVPGGTLPVRGIRMVRRRQLVHRGEGRRAG